jgi:hypothetical protein
MWPVLTDTALQNNIETGKRFQMKAEYTDSKLIQ